MLYEGGPYHNWPRDRITRARRYVIHRADVGKSFQRLAEATASATGRARQRPLHGRKGLRFAEPTFGKNELASLREANSCSHSWK